MSFRDIGKALFKGREIAGAVDQLDNIFGDGSNITPDPNNPFSIETFKAKVSEENAGLMKSNKFLVTFTFPESSLLSVGDKEYANKSIQFFCSDANLPGLSFTTAETRRHGVGPINFYPTSPIYGELPLTFMVDGKGKAIEFFHKWANSTMMLGEDPGAKVEGVVPKSVQQSGAYPYELYYRNQYAGICTITVLNDTADSVLEYELFNTSLMSIGDTPVSWETGDIMKVTCSFRFDGYKLNNINTSQPVSSSRGLSTFNTITGLYAAAQTVYGVARKPSSISDAISIVKNVSTLPKVFGG